MDNVLKDCGGFSAAYRDVVVYSESWENHLQHLRNILGKIQEAGLTINEGKCYWAQEEVRYLGC